VSQPQSAEDAIQDAAERQITDMIRRLIAAARDGRAHLSHEDGANCMGCRAVRQAIEFVKAMSSDEVPAEETSA
jgi:hypothetical protein